MPEMRKYKFIVLNGSDHTKQIFMVVTCFFLDLVAQCPPPCECNLGIADCSARRLSSLPPMPARSYLVFNASFNYLSSFSCSKEQMSGLRVLDLSHNQISMIPASIFSAGSCSRLDVLNFTGNNLRSLPFELPASLKVLKLSHNKFQTFSLSAVRNLTELETLHLSYNDITMITTPENHNFSNDCPFEPFQKLIEVFFQGNKLTMLDVHIFQCFQKVVYMSLADNSIDSIPAQLFSSFQQLRFLDLSRNSLTFIPAGTFSKMSSMKYLSLANNHLETVPVNLPMMEWLNLSNNSITAVAEQQKTDLYPQEVFLIGRNPLHCDCGLLWLKELFDSRKYLLKYIQVDKEEFVPTCSHPAHIAGILWDVLEDEVFGCKDKAGKEDDITSDHGNKLLIHLENLSIRVSDVGHTHVSLEWDPLNLMTVDKANYAGLGTKAYVSYHQFGKKTQFSVAIHLITGSYTLKGLRPSTAYIICMSLEDPMLKSSHVKVAGEDCVEITTEKEKKMQTFLADGYVVVLTMSLMCGLLMILCCCLRHFYQKVKRE